MWDFVDLSSKAKELGITEGTLRARILSGQERCYVYASLLNAYAKESNTLIARSDDQFPMVGWEDLGAWDYSKDFRPTSEWAPSRSNRYRVRGWVVLAEDAVDLVLTQGETQWDYVPVYICDAQENVVCPLRFRVEPKKEWVKADSGEYVDGGYWRNVDPVITSTDLFLRSPEVRPKPLSHRKEQSYLGIIAALRALLRSRDGGGFPSDAKIIDFVVQHFRTEGVSKRNLEKVFADASGTTKFAQDATKDRREEV